MSEENYDRGHATDANEGGQTGTATAKAADTAPVKVCRDENNVVKIGAWKTLPPGYELLTNHGEIMEALTNFNSAELRNKIADLATNKY